MKKYDIIIKISKLWNMCEYWTLNRAFLKTNPNVSREYLNDTYGLTSDDKEYFFIDYMRMVCNQLVLSGIFRLLIKNNQTAWEGKNIKIDEANDSIHFYITAKDYFAGAEFNAVLYKYIQFKILWWWYKLKNMDEILQRIEMLLTTFEDELLGVVADSTSNGSSVGTLIYHDGFVNRYDRTSISGDTTDYGEAITIGEDESDTPSDPSTPTEPSEDPNDIIFEDSNKYYFGKDLPQSIMVDIANINGELDNEVHLVDNIASSKLQYQMKLYKNPEGEPPLARNGTLVFNFALQDDGTEVWQEIDILALQQSNILPVVVRTHIQGAYDSMLQYGDKVYFEFTYKNQERRNGNNYCTIKQSTLCELLQPLPTQLFETTFDALFE